MKTTDTRTVELSKGKKKGLKESNQTPSTELHTLKLYKVTKQYVKQNLIKYQDDIYFSKTKSKALKLIKSEQYVNKHKPKNNADLLSEYEFRYVLTEYIQKSIETKEYIGVNLMEYKKLYYDE